MAVAANALNRATRFQRTENRESAPIDLPGYGIMAGFRTPKRRAREERALSSSRGPRKR